MNSPLDCQNEDNHMHLIECDKVDVYCIIGLDEEIRNYQDLFGNNVV